MPGMKSLVTFAAVASAAAAGIHFAVAPEHFDEWWGFGTFFVVSGAAQLAWAAFPRKAWIGIAGNALFIALWAVSRTRGLPIGPEAGTPEAVGPLDVISVALELSAIGALVMNRFTFSGEWITSPLRQQETQTS
jgi:hypothetical protein